MSYALGLLILSTAAATVVTDGLTLEPPARLIETDTTDQQRVIVTFSGPPLLDVPAANRSQHRSRLAQRHRDFSTTLDVTPHHQYTTVQNGVAVTLTPAQIDRARRLPYVQTIHEDVQLNISLSQSVSQIAADAVHTKRDAAGRTVTGDGVTIAILDTGIAYNHSLFGNCTATDYAADACPRFAGTGYDFVNDDADPYEYVRPRHPRCRHRRGQRIVDRCGAGCDHPRTQGV